MQIPRIWRKSKPHISTETSLENGTRGIALAESNWRANRDTEKVLDRNGATGHDREPGDIDGRENPSVAHAGRRIIELKVLIHQRQQ